jgi:hypothetical protein
MRIAVLIITRGKERADFVAFAARQIQLQTQQTDRVLFVDHEPENNIPDITGRYRKGYEQLKSEGFDVVFFIEDDDYYSPYYIENMMAKWKQYGRPEIFGSHLTTYYHLINQHITKIEHRGRASMFSTMMRLDIEQPIAWGLSSYKFTDLVLWNQLKGKTFEDSKHQLDIKHGMGLCSGSGHKLSFMPKQTTQDQNHDFLRKFVTPEAFEFYMNIKTKLTAK